MPHTILTVEDDPTQRRLLASALRNHGFEVMLAESGEEALALVAGDARKKISLMLLDLVMPNMDGMAVLERLRPNRPDLPVIVLTAQSGIDVIVNVMRAGAVDFIPKPASPERLKVSIENALKLNALSGEVSRLIRRAEGNLGFGDLVTASAAMAAAIDLARRGAASSIPILIEGESGVGKEMIARAIQGSSDRAGKAFIAVNCGAIPENLVESILFGHEKGSFTGATERHIGKFQEADGGTLFLDEIGELRPDIQVKLLRALQEGEIDAIGSRQPVKVDVRLISASNRDLAALVEDNSFREDLYYRLSVFPIVIPPLRERPEDIRPLAEHFLAKFAATESKAVSRLSEAALDLLQRFEWRGNVRQLENAIFRAVVLCDGDVLDVGDFPQIAQSMGLPASHRKDQAAGTANRALFAGDGHIRQLCEVEADMIRVALDKYSGQMSEVARRLGIGRSTLYRKVRGLGLDAAPGSQTSPG